MRNLCFIFNRIARLQLIVMGGLLTALPVLSDGIPAPAPLTVIEMMINNATHITSTELASMQASLQRQGITLFVYNLDAPAALRQVLNHNLPADPEAAKNIVLKRLNEHSAMDLKQRYRTAYQGVMKSAQYQLDRYPALVFNQGQAVIYGITDLQSAIQLYQNWRVAQ